MSYQAVEAVFASSASKGADRLVLLAIAARINDKTKVCWPSLERIAADANLSVRKVVDAIDELVESGELVVQHRAGPGMANVYAISLRPPQNNGAKTESKVQTNRNEPVGEKRKTNTAARSQSSRAVVRTDSNPTRKTWGDGCPEYPIDREVLRIDTAGSPKPRVPKQEPPHDPLMQARAKPKSSAAAAGGGGPLFGEPEKPKAPPAAKPPSDEIIVRDAFQDAYKGRYEILAKWGSAEAKQAKDLMRTVREAAEKRQQPPESVLARLCTAYLADDDAFLKNNAHRFLHLGGRAPKYLSEILRLGRGKGPVFQTGSW